MELVVARKKNPYPTCQGKKVVAGVGKCGF
jgi:hypothetical protein